MIPYVIHTYLDSWTPIGKLRAWRCQSQDCLAFCRLLRACLCCQRCDSVRLAFRGSWRCYKCCFCECSISLVCGVGYHGVFRLRETERMLLLMAEEDARCLIKGHKATWCFFQVIRRIRDYGSQSSEHQLLLVSLSVPTAVTYCMYVATLRKYRSPRSLQQRMIAYWCHARAANL